MTRKPEKVDKVHENVRDSTEGVETEPGSDGSSGGEPATGLIGNGQMTDPRYLAQR